MDTQASRLIHPVLIRKSTVIFICRILLIELIFAGFFLLLRSPFHFEEGVLTENIAQYETINFFTIVYLIFLIIKIIWIIQVTLTWANQYYELEPGQITYTKGTFYETKQIYSILNIQQITLKQSFLGKIFRFGSIQLYNPYLKKYFYMTQIQDPKKYVKLIGDCIPTILNNEIEKKDGILFTQ